ncbi:MAG TPA: hypothetical protein VD927_10970 [Chryseosolibacter sp.]|nr:hypothetical protein [Chryseosolibacter sp.]
MLVVHWPASYPQRYIGHFSLPWTLHALKKRQPHSAERPFVGCRNARATLPATQSAPEYALLNKAMGKTYRKKLIIQYGRDLRRQMWDGSISIV